MPPNNSLPNSLLDKLAADISHYAENIIDWNKYFLGYLTPDEYAALSYNIEEMLRELQNAFIGFSGTKGQWGKVEFMDLNNILFIHLYHKKQSIDIQVGVNETGFFLNIGIPKPENIPNVADGFWLEWLQLGKLGDFTFQASTQRSKDFESAAEKRHFLIAVVLNGQ